MTLCPEGRRITGSQLINEKAVATNPDFTNDWYTGLGNGTYATWLTAAWGPVFLSGVAAKSAGDWAVAPLPQWNASDQTPPRTGVVRLTR